MGRGRRNRKSRNVKPRQLINSSDAPFPPGMVRVFEYGQCTNMLEAAVGAGVQQVWNANSLFDPDGTGVGHQPLYYDQLLSATGPYTRYVVFRVTIEVTVTNISANPVVFALYGQPGTMDYPSRDLLMEKPMSKRVFLSQSGGGQTTRKVQMTIPVEKLFGVTRARLHTDDVFTGIYNANPSQLGFIVAMMYNMPGGGVVAQVSLATRIRFHARLYGRSAIAGS